MGHDRALQALNHALLLAFVATTAPLACRSRTDSGRVSTDGSVPPRDGGGLEYVTAVEPLPPVATSFKPPARRETTGRCWVTYERLPDEQLAAIQRAFLQRNPGWEMKDLYIDPYTGLINQSHNFRTPAGPRVALSDEVYAQRRLAPLRRNADFLGLRDVDLAAIRWEPGSFWGSTEDLRGSTAVGTIPARSGSTLRGVFRDVTVSVDFRRDGVVTGFGARLGTPVVETGNRAPVEGASAICTTPGITAEQARAARGLFDASLQPARLGAYRGGNTVKPNEVGDARLAIAEELDNMVLPSEAKSMTWRLVWEVNVRGGSSTYKVDAVSGRVVGYRINRIR